jgi:hypothetical protein
MPFPKTAVAGYISANYHPTLTKYGTQTEENIPSQKTQKRESDAKFQDGHRHLEKPLQPESRPIIIRFDEFLVHS